MKPKVTKEQAETLIQVARMLKDIPSETVIKAFENGFEIEDETLRIEWWEKHGRKDREVRTGDIIVNNTGYTLVVSTTEKEIVRFTNKGWIFKDEIEKGNYEIACFVED